MTASKRPGQDRAWGKVGPSGGLSGAPAGDAPGPPRRYARKRAADRLPFHTKRAAVFA